MLARGAWPKTNSPERSDEPSPRKEASSCCDCHGKYSHGKYSHGKYSHGKYSGKYTPSKYRMRRPPAATVVGEGGGTQHGVYGGRAGGQAGGERSAPRQPTARAVPGRTGATPLGHPPWPPPRPPLGHTPLAPSPHLLGRVLEEVQILGREDQEACAPAALAQHVLQQLLARLVRVRVRVG